jgi:RNA polymerase sigma factor (sigma-70 family)
MARQVIGTFIEQLRRSTRGSAHGLSDAGLLQRFAAHGDEAAFAILVERFGPMVLGVCRRAVGDVHAAEDAFQATFLVLARKAASLVHQELVGNWLWGVAYRTARRARVEAARWHSRKREVQVTMAPDPVEEVMWRDLRPVLDEEIYRLPAKYRLPFVLCYLEGKTNEQAARKLGCPPGTVFTRLARARELLRDRLTRRGVTLSGAVLAASVTREATARVPPSLASSTVKAAALFAAGKTAVGVTMSIQACRLAEGALQAMFLSKVKIVLGALFTVATLGGAGALYAHRVQAGAEAGREQNGSAAMLAPQSPPAPKTKQETMPAEQGSAKKPEDKKAEADSVHEGEGFGFGRGFGMGADRATATATVNTGSHSESVSVRISGSGKLATLSQPAFQRELALSSQQLKQISELQDKQQRALRAIAPRKPTDAHDAPEVLREIERAGENVKKLIKEMDRTIDELLTDKQRQRLRKIMLQL